MQKDPNLQSEEEVKKWVKDLFYFYGKQEKYKNPPQHIIDYYAQELITEEMDFPRVRNEVYYLVNPSINELSKKIQSKKENNDTTERINSNPDPNIVNNVNNFKNVNDNNVNNNKREISIDSFHVIEDNGNHQPLYKPIEYNNNNIPHYDPQYNNNGNNNQYPSSNNPPQFNPQSNQYDNNPQYTNTTQFNPNNPNTNQFNPQYNPQFNHNLPSNNNPPQFNPQYKPVPNTKRNEINPEMLREWLNKLFEKYIGKKDPALFTFIYDSVLNGSYSINEAEMAVKFSKESKQYQVQKLEESRQSENKKKQQITEYVNELYRVYRKILIKNDGSDDPKIINERNIYVQEMIDGTMNAESLENLFELDSLPKKK